MSAFKKAYMTSPKCDRCDAGQPCFCPRAIQGRQIARDVAANGRAVVDELRRVEAELRMAQATQAVPRVSAPIPKGYEFPVLSKEQLIPRNKGGYLESETVSKCSAGAACPIHHPKKVEPFRPSIDEWDLLPDAPMFGGRK